MENKRKRILDIDPQAILWDGLDEAIVGITEEGIPVYDIHQMEILLMKEYTWEWEDAAEWVEFNILRVYLGDRTPIHMWTMPKEIDNIHNCIRCNNPIDYDNTDWCDVCDMSIFDEQMNKF